ncbi:MAG: SpoIID/LytB domain-containing protein [Janthinobacterium lividum]
MRSALIPALLLAIPMQAIPIFSHAAPPSSPPLRIGLDHLYRHSTTLLVSCDRPFTLSDTLSNHPIAHGAAGTLYKMRVSPTSILLARADDLKDTPIPDSGAAALSVTAGQGGFLKIARMDSRPLGSKGIPWHQYRGFLTIRKEADTTLRVINTVALEPYLYGVIPAEIGANVPMEAMKAQAVAARTYALKNRGKCAADGFDLDDTTHCEGYFGMDGETALSNAAVDATRTQVLTYGGQLIDAIFSTDSGGVTACDLSGDCPYLQAVKDCDAADADYAANGRYHTWTQAFTSAQIAAAVAKDPRTHVNRFMSLTIDGLDASGRITTATVAGTDGTLKTVTGPQIRQILGYDVLRSTRVIMTRLPNGSYQFAGKGWGHGMGMSQDGAVAMAGLPYRKTYKEILTHYYVGAKITGDNSVVASISNSTLAARPGF